MGNLGFLYNLNYSNQNRQIVIFTFSKKFEGNIIIGSNNLLKNSKEINYLFLSQNLKLEKFQILENFKFKYSKIKLFNQKILDFKDFVFFLKPYQYKELKNLFEIEICEKYKFNEKIKEINFSKLTKEVLIKNTLEIYEIL